MRPTLIEKSSTVLPPILVRCPMVVGSSEPSRRVMRSRSSATCRSCSSICFLCVSTVSWANFYPVKCRQRGHWRLPGKGLPSSSVHSCIARQRPIAREMVAVATVGGVAVVGDIAGIADNPGEVAGTWRSLSKLLNPALHFVPDFLSISPYRKYK